MIIRICILMLLQLIISLVLIYHGKNKTSYFTEIALAVIAMAYNNRPFAIEEIFVYVAEYIIVKILILIIIWVTKYFSFYALVSISKRNGKIAQIGYKIFGKKKFPRFVSNMWNKVDYGIRIKKGIPGMVGKKHQRTSIYFDKDGFPKFKAIATVKLSRKFYNKTRETHFYQASKMLYERIQKDKKLASKFTKKEIQTFKQGDTPSKYTWHHHQNRGVLQLVDREVHANVNHRGGFSIWGKR